MKAKMIMLCSGIVLVFCAVVLPISAYGDTPNISWVGPRQTSPRYSGGIMVGFVSAPHFINEGGPGTIEISGRIEKDGSLHSTFETKYFYVESGRDYELFIEGDVFGDWMSQTPPFVNFGLIIDSSPPAYTLQLPMVPASMDASPSASITNIELRQGFSNYLLLSTDRLTIAEGSTATFTVSLRLDPFGTFEVAVANESGDSDITVESGASLVFDSSNYSVPQSVTLRAAEDEDRFNGTASIAVTAPGLDTRRVTVTERDNEPYVNIVLVDADAPGANDGSSWANAYNYLQDALTAASSGYEIWVAQGIYKPDQGATVTPGYRTASFQLLEGVAVRGGYAGFGQPDPDARDIDNYKTILNGDLSGDDVEVNDPCDLRTEPSRAENSYHVVTASHTGASAVLDGFTIKAGNANGALARSYHRGGGMHYYEASPTLTDCTFIGNSANTGGGMYNGSSNSPTLTDCTFTGNAASYGGGMYNGQSSDPTLTNCIFSGNWAKYDGGGMCDYYYSSPAVTNCTFSENTASDKGGGMYNNYKSSPTVTNCTFNGNSAKDGGGMYNWTSSPTLTNCIFSGNSAGNYGGGMLNLSSNLTLTNSTFSGNLAGSGGGGISNYDNTAEVINCTFSENSTDNHGGGIYNDNANSTLIDCQFTGNSAEYGGGVLNNSSDSMLTNCTFSGNMADFEGGGLLDYINTAVVVNCVFCGNSAGNYGGGVYNQENNSTISNCILWGNTSPNGSQVAVYSNSTTALSYTNAEGGEPAVYLTADSSLTWGSGNIDADPLFVDGDNAAPGLRDYHLLPGSLCIDTGDNSAVPGGVTTDLDGRLRIADGDCNDTDVVDMGAYEFGWVYIGDFDNQCDVDQVDFAIFALAWLTEPPDAQWNPGCDISIPADNSIDMLDLAVLVKHWIESPL